MKIAHASIGILIVMWAITAEAANTFFVSTKVIIDCGERERTELQSDPDDPGIVTLDLDESVLIFGDGMVENMLPGVALEPDIQFPFRYIESVSDRRGEFLGVTERLRIFGDVDRSIVGRVTLDEEGIPNKLKVTLVAMVLNNDRSGLCLFHVRLKSVERVN